MPKNIFDCNKCGEAHQRPINSKCKVIVQKEQEESEINFDTQDTNALILQELKSLSVRMAPMERKVNRSPHSTSWSQGSSSKATPAVEDSEEEENDELILPSIKSLQQSKRMQSQVDLRIEQLKDLNEQGKFKSQRGGGRHCLGQERGSMAP